MKSFFKRLAHGLRREDGTASIEFVMAVPVLMTIFMASFESGLLMTRSVMLERAVDITMRELRLGHYVNPDATLLKAEICKRTVIFDDCAANIRLELIQVDKTTWRLPTSSTACINRDEEFQVPDTFMNQTEHDMMLMRVCVRQDLMFPTSGLGLKLATDSQGGFGLIAISAFVIEPD